MTDDSAHPGRGPGPRHARGLYARVLIVQAIALLALWALQALFGAA